MPTSAVLAISSRTNLQRLKMVKGIEHIGSTLQQVFDSEGRPTEEHEPITINRLIQRFPSVGSSLRRSHSIVIPACSIAISIPRSVFSKTSAVPRSIPGGIATASDSSGKDTSGRAYPHRTLLIFSPPTEAAGPSASRTSRDNTTWAIPTSKFSSNPWWSAETRKCEKSTHPVEWQWFPVEDDFYQRGRERVE